MLTRRKNRVKKNGKKRYMSRKMRGGDMKDELEQKYKVVMKKKDDLKKKFDKLNGDIDNLNNNIEKTLNNIILFNEKTIISDEFDNDKKQFLYNLNEYYKSIKPPTKELPSPYKIPPSKPRKCDNTSKVKTAIEKVKTAIEKIKTIENDANCTEFIEYERIYTEYKKNYKNSDGTNMDTILSKIDKEIIDKEIIDEENNDSILKNREVLKKLFKKFIENINTVFTSKKNEYDKLKDYIIGNAEQKNILQIINFEYTQILIDYCIDMYNYFNNLHTQNVYISELKTLIFKINKRIDSLKKPIEKITTVTDISITPKDYENVDVTEGHEIYDIAYIFYRLHDTELVKTFLEEWLKVLKEEKLKEKLKEKEKEKEKEEEKEKEKEKEKAEGKVGGGKLLGGAKENQIENKLNELLSKMYTNGVRDKIQNVFDNFSNSALDDKINVVTEIIKVVNVVNVEIKKYEEIKSNKTKQQIIYKIITSKIEDESNEAEYTDAMTRENALKILHVYDEKNSKEIKDKYKMTKDMWTDILNNVTEKDRKPLIYKIISKVNASYDTLYQDKETTIDINFYKSVFNNNPFPYKELINVTRTGEGVTPIIYGVEELFKLYEDELKFIKDNKSNDAVKPPLKQKKIEVTHKRKNPEFPSIFDSST
jgi:hypothetical protein